MLVLHSETRTQGGQALGANPWVLDAGAISACTRKRAYWASFEAEAPALIEVDRELDPNPVLEPGRSTWWRKLPTIVASGQSTWNTCEVVVDEWGQAGPLSIGEMEAAMEYDMGYTEAEGLSMRSRFKLIGNAFHAGMLMHLLLCYASDAALKGLLLRGHARQTGVPFTERDEAVHQVRRQK